MIQMSPIVEPLPSLPPAESRIRFDVAFGIVLPILCFAFDPIVFRNGIGMGGFLAPHLVVSLVFAATQMTLLATWLIAGPSLERWAAPVSGFLFVGALGSILLGIVILPLSVVGLSVGIGLLGFTPFMTGYVYYRSAMSAARSAWNHRPRVFIAAGLVAGIAWGAFIPLEVNRLFQDAVDRSLSSLDSEDFAERDNAVRTLEVLKHFNSPDAVVVMYQRELNADRRARLKAAYQRLTGEDIDYHWSGWGD